MKLRSPQAGYALLTLLVVAALGLILLGVEMPRILTQGQRELEEELIFRGEQYRRALALHFRKYGRLPLKLEELAEPKNNLRFLRQLYPDPMSDGSEWRLIRVGPMGELVGSVTRERIQMPTAGQEQKGGDRPGQAGGRPAEPSREPLTGGVNLPIIGIASRSTQRSIRVFQGEATYNAWEFIYDPAADAARRAPQPTRPPSGPSPVQPQAPPRQP